MDSSWRPQLEDGPAALYDKIVSAMQRDIDAQVLPAGARLPPQRILAHALGVSVGTVTRAYVDAELRGLVSAHVGRGTFVTDQGRLTDRPRAAAAPLIDLALNFIPFQAAERRFAESLATLSRRVEMADAMAYAAPVGPDSHRKASVTWLSRIAGFDADWTQVIMTLGGQHAMSLAFQHLVRPGETVLCEAATFYGMKSLAEHGRFALRGVALDDEGMVPSALEAAIRATEAKVVYLMPTVQNPTGRTMGPQRLADIAALVRKYELWVVEDDNYALFRPNRDQAPPLMAMRVPDRTFYVGGVSKALAPGLRTGFLICPPGPHLDAIVRSIRATIYTPSMLGGLFFSQWVQDGSAWEVAEAVRADIGRRAHLARGILGLPDDTPVAPHIWLPMSELQAERVASRARRAGVAVTPPDAPIVPGDRVSGLRICLGCAPTVSLLTTGLERLRGALSSDPEGADLGMV